MVMKLVVGLRVNKLLVAGGCGVVHVYFSDRSFDRHMAFVCVCVHVRVHACLGVCLCAHPSEPMRAYSCECSCMCVHVFTLVCEDAHTCTYVNTLCAR